MVSDMKEKLRVVTVVGTRPEIIRLSRVMTKLDQSNAIDHISIHTGQNYDYELNQIFYDDLDIRKADYFLNAAGATTIETIGQMLIKIDQLLESLKPDALLVLGDTNSCLCAIPAKKRHIPIFHMEAGNRCFDQRVPEESNRKIVDHISDINLTYSDIAREYLLREGLSPAGIIKTGSPMYEVLNYYLPQIKSSDILNRLDISKDKYFVVSAHREENINNERNFNGLIEVLNIIADKYHFPIIFSTHPRTRKMIESKDLKMGKEVQFLKPLGFIDYNSLQINSYAVLSDSGTISEESSILNFRALNIREAHERPEAMEQTSIMMVGLKAERILQGLVQLEYQEIGDKRNFLPVSDYSVPNVSDKIVRIILSYTDYIKKTVWRE
jgi:UDP-N-acetyl-L-fucosamine synthase